MKAAILYARVSTDEQAEKGTSLDSQMDTCRRYATSHGMEVIAEYKDDFSGSRLDRPGLQELIKMIERRAADAVIVLSSDRWARKMQVLLTLREILKETGTELHYAMEGKVEFTPEGEVMDDVKGSFNAYWKAKIIYYTKQGRNDRATGKDGKPGRPVMTGQPPYGYHKVGMLKTAALEIDEREAMVVKKIFELYTTGNGTGTPQSLRAIAFELTRAGEPTPHNTKRNIMRWRPETIQGILKNEIYAGRTYYGKTRVNDSKRTKQDRENWIPIQVPELAIIDRATFEAAQSQRVRNLELSRRNRKHDYLLSGFFWCSACNQVMSGCYAGSPPKYFYYRCTNHWHRPEREPCPNENISLPTNKVDVKVWEWIESLWVDEEQFNRGIMGITERNQAKMEPMIRQYDRLQALIDKQDQKAARFIAQLGDIDDPEIITMVKQQAKEAVTLRDQMRAEAGELEAAIKGDIVSPEMIERLHDLITKIREGRARLNYEGKRAIMNMLAVEVIFREDETGRWLDVSCGLHPEVIGLCLS